jgi:hypothetical protein
MFAFLSSFQPITLIDPEFLLLTGTILYAILRLVD